MTTPTVERLHQRPATDAVSLPGRFLSVTSFKRDGTGVATPVWFVATADRIYALTDLHSPKVWRIRRNPDVLIAPCRVSGRLRGAPIPARAEVATAASDLEHVQALLRDRYKLSYRIVMLGYRLARRLRGKTAVADGAALVITLKEPLDTEEI
jgi:PPOX class probable F420-dependent enzyme